jgi:hypothetical protein
LEQANYENSENCERGRAGEAERGERMNLNSGKERGRRRGGELRINIEE